VEISKLFGLPAHPLLVHVPIVLIPLVALASLVLAVAPRTRAHLAPVTAAFAGVALVGVQLALGSGEALEPHVRKSALLERHTELADALRPLMLVLFVLLLAAVLLHRRPAIDKPWLVSVVFVLALVAGLATTARVVQVGHAGARATWHDTDMTQRAGRGD
jgi:uncharacterized membrane protein